MRHPYYLLLPTNKAQKMLLILGKGGEGKSVVGLVLQRLLGNNMNVSSIQALTNSRFQRAAQEFKLLMLDDDMQIQYRKNIPVGMNQTARGYEGIHAMVRDDV